MRYIIINTFCVMVGALALFLAYSAFVDAFGSHDAKFVTLIFFLGSFFVAAVFGPHSCDKHTIEKEKHVYHETDPDLLYKIKDLIKKNLPPRIVQGVQIKVAHPEKNKMEAKGIARNVKLEEEIIPEEPEPLFSEDDSYSTEMELIDEEQHLGYDSPTFYELLCKKRPSIKIEKM